MAAENSDSAHPSIWVSNGTCSGSVYVGVMGRDLDPKDNFTLCSATYSMEVEKTQEPDLSEIQACCFENDGDYSCERNNCLMHEREHVLGWKECVRAAESNLFSCTAYPMQRRHTSGAKRASVRAALVLSVALAAVNAV